MGNLTMPAGVSAAVITDPDPMDELRAALDGFVQTARYTSGIPAAAVNGLRHPDACVFTTTVYGAPITVSKGAGAMTPEEVYLAWREVQAHMPEDGAHVHVTNDGDVRVDTLAHTSGVVA